MIKLLNKSNKVVVVGDDNQSLYHFKKAKPDLIINLYKDDSTEEFSLDYCYRCTRVIVDAALSHVHPTPFKITISSDDVSETKPNPEGYLKAASLLNVDILSCLILEDSATGVKAAQASGAKVIAVPHLVKIERDFQTKVLKSLEELDTDLLRELYLNW